MKLRLKNDTTQWILQKFIPGGDVITKGKFKGRIKESRWVDIGYYNWIDGAVIGMYHEMLRAKFPDTIEITSVESVMKKLEEVRSDVKLWAADVRAEVESK